MAKRHDSENRETPKRDDKIITTTPDLGNEPRLHNPKLPTYENPPPPPKDDSKSQQE